MSINKGMDKEVVEHIHNGILFNNKKNEFESVLVKWMNLELVRLSKLG